MSSTSQFALAILAAAGIDETGVTRLTVDLDVNEMPKIIVERFVPNPDTAQLETITETWTQR